MTTRRSLFERLDDARARLGDPATVWFRGHAGRHQLVPTLFRFRGGVEAERALYESYRDHSGDGGLVDAWTTLISMHDSYLPTRLLAWTESLGVAMFCAMLREIPVIFVLDPIALNQASHVPEMVDVRHDWQPDYHRVVAGGGPELPFALRPRPALAAVTANRLASLFTAHGRCGDPLEQQVPDVVERVLVSDVERASAYEYLLSMNWFTGDHRSE